MCMNDVCVLTWIEWKMDGWIGLSGCGCGKWKVARFRISHMSPIPVMIVNVHVRVVIFSITMFTLAGYPLQLQLIGLWPRLSSSVSAFYRFADERWPQEWPLPGTNLSKWVGIWIFRLKRRGSDNQHIFKITQPIDIKFQHFFGPPTLRCGWSGSSVLKIYDNDRRHSPYIFLENANNIGLDGYMSTKPGGIIDDIAPKRRTWPRCKPQVEFQYCCRLFSITGSGNISAMHRDISAKFGLQIDFDFLRWVLSLNAQPEVYKRWFRSNFRSLKLIRRHNPTGHGPIEMKFGKQLQNHMLLTIEKSKSKPEVESACSWFM